MTSTVSLDDFYSDRPEADRLQRGWIYDGDYAAMVREELATGRHRRPERWPGLFMDGFFRDMDDVGSEVEASKSVPELIAASPHVAVIARRG